MTNIILTLKLALSLLLAVQASPAATTLQKQQALAFSVAAVQQAKAYLAAPAAPVSPDTPIVGTATDIPSSDAPVVSEAPTPQPTPAAPAIVAPSLEIGGSEPASPLFPKSYRLLVKQPVTLKTLVLEVFDKADRNIYPNPVVPLVKTDGTILTSLNLRECMTEAATDTPCPRKHITTPEEYQAAATMGYISRLSLNLQPGVYFIDLPSSVNLIYAEWTDANGLDTFKNNIPNDY